jgi:hypothetical protein
VRKIIWSCWFQGRNEAPEVVRKCLQSWEDRNPGWDVRVLDSNTISRYIDVFSHVDLAQQRIASASLSDIVRILLLHEYGGVWVDATTFCNVPLDDWLPVAANTGFFAFARPAEDRLLGSWFLAAEPGNELLAKWTARAIRYWRGREETDDYFWLHHQFGELCSIDKKAFRAWLAVPQISANGPISLCYLSEAIYEDFDAVKSRIDWTIPVFKLTHGLDASRITPNSLVVRLLGMAESNVTSPPAAPRAPESTTSPICLLKVSTHNLGDHIQIIAAEGLLRRAGLVPSDFVDRDHGVAHPPEVPSELSPGILLNGWFANNASEWPPHRAYRALYLGFHIRLWRAPNLLSPAALDHYASHGPVGCRDRYTLSLLRSHGVEAFLSYCVSITFARRLHDPDRQREVFVVSSDRRILDYLPDSIGPYTFINHYSNSSDFDENKNRASELLNTYRDKAKLVITTMLHCALPVIAMGIPVVVFYPPNEGPLSESDRERFSSLSELVRVFRPSEAALVDWLGYTPDVSSLKLKLVDSFFAMATRWGQLAPPPIEPTTQVAPLFDVHRYFENSDRLAELARTKSPDRRRWGANSSYKPAWAERGKVAAQFIRDGSRVLEIGTGPGTLRELIAHRCHYTGADLEPLDEKTLALDLDNDPMPSGMWDTIVLLGVLEHLHHPAEALRKITNITSQLVISYCCCMDDSAGCTSKRLLEGYTTSMTEKNIRDTFAALGFHTSRSQLLNSTPYSDEIVFEFAK